MQCLNAIKQAYINTKITIIEICELYILVFNNVTYEINYNVHYVVMNISYHRRMPIMILWFYKNICHRSVNIL